MSRVYETAVKIGATISKAFKRDTVDAAASIDKLSKSTKKLQEAEKSAAAFKKLDEEIKRSKAKYDQAAAALRRLEEAEKAAGGATKESTQWQKAGARAVAAAAREMDRATKAAEKNAKALHELGIDTSKLEKEQKRLAAASRMAGLREKIFGKSKEDDPVPLMDALKGKTAKAGEQIKGLARDAALLGVAAGGAGVALGGLVMKSLNTADEIGDTAGKIGISAKALQELRYGAKDAGAESQDLDKSLSKMLVTIGHFKNAKAKAGGGGGGAIAGLEMLPDVGGGDSAGSEDQDPFKRLGLNAKKLAALEPEQQIRAIADGISKLKTQADKAAASAAIFGKGGVALVPMFEKGAAGLDEMATAANKYGGVLDDKVLKKADVADKAFRDAEMAFGGLATTLGSAFLPVATKVFTQFAEWVAKNREQIKAWAESAAKWIEGKAIPAIVKFGTEAKALIDKVVGGASKVAAFVGGWDRLAIILAGLRFAPLVKSIADIGLEAGKAAVALLRLAAAKSAAGGGGGGGLVGAAGKLGLVGAALGGGLAIGTALDEKFGLSDKAADAMREATGAGAEDRAKIAQGVASHQSMLAQKKAQREALIRQFEARGLSHGKAIFQAEQALAGGAGGGKTEINLGGITIGGDPTRDQLSKGMDAAKQKVMGEYDERQRRRVSFGE